MLKERVLLTFFFFAVAGPLIYGAHNVAHASGAISNDVTYQAENATIVNGVVESNYSGYTGAGFVNYKNMVGSYIQWTISAPQSGRYNLSFRYANGTTVNRPLEIRVNGTIKNPRLAFLGTGAWSNWQRQGIDVSLRAGSNTIKAYATTSNGGPNMDRVDVSSPLQGTDWAKAVIDSTIQRYPTPSSLGPWHYAKSFFLYGTYVVYKRTGDDRYLRYIKNWVDLHVDSSGNIDAKLDSLDNMQPGNLLLILYQTSGQSKYKTAAAKIRQRFNTYPRTSDGGLWHMVSKVGQLWLDGAYMAMPFLARYGILFGDRTYTANESAGQIVIYGNHLRDASTGLYFHAYDEQGDVSWAEPSTHHSSYFWGRSIGWYGMATVDVIENLPKTHAKRPVLIANLKSLVAALARYQHANSGLWYQVVDKGSLSSNWHETSCSAMFTYITARAIERGFVDATYQTVATKGLQGVLSKVYIGSDGLTNVKDISAGTGVGDLNYYLTRPRETNAFHGLGAFLFMYEQMK